MRLAMTPPLLLRSCPECSGRGKRAISGLPGFTDCSRCSGSGKVKEDMNAPKEHRCPHCGIRFAWDGTAWLTANAHGHLDRIPAGSGKRQPEPEIRECPSCRRPLQIGAARVEEVRE